jgi:hypothetical protein
MTIEAMKQALEALGKCRYRSLADEIVDPAITALRAAIEQAEEQEPVAWRNAAIRLGEELSSVGPDGYYNMTAEQWLDWAMDQHPQGKNSLTTPPAAQQEPRCAVIVEVFGKDWRLDYMSLPVGKHRLYTQEYVYTTPPAAQRQPHEWIAVDECMPEPGAYVLAVFRYTTGKQRVIRAMHAPQKTLSEDDYGEFVTEGADYDETTDTTYWPEGWYECNENEETHWQVHEEVTHWMPLPAAPSVGEKPDAA